MNNSSLLHFIKEIAFLLVIAVISYLVTSPYRTHISERFLFFHIMGLFVIAQYFRVVIFERKIAWMRPFAMKVLFMLLNIPLFFLIITWMMTFNGQLEDYSYDIQGIVTKDIFAGLQISQFEFLRTMTYFVGLVTLILIVIFQLRVIYSIFKYREVPKFS